MANFNDTLKFLRGNTFINYEQLGLKFKLFSCEVLFNRGLSYVYMGQMEAGLADLGYAAKEKMISDHDVIDEAIKEDAEVRVKFQRSSSYILISQGLHRLLHTCWRDLSTEQR